MKKHFYLDRTYKYHALCSEKLIVEENAIVYMKKEVTCKNCLRKLEKRK